MRRADEHLHPRAVADRLELVERDVEPVGDRVRAGRDERVAAGDIFPLDAGQAHCDALARLGPLDLAVVDLHAADADASAGGLHEQLVPGTDRARAERAR